MVSWPNDCWPCGTYAIPRATRWCGRSPVTSSPSSSTVPGTRLQQPHRGPQQRRLAGAVVAHHGGHPVGRHLDGRPRAARRSGRTRRGHRRSSSIRSTASDSGGRGAEIDLLHARVGLHLRDRSLAAAPCRRRSTVTDLAKRPHEVHVVLDDDDGALARRSAAAVRRSRRVRRGSSRRPARRAAAAARPAPAACRSPATASGRGPARRPAVAERRSARSSPAPRPPRRGSRTARRSRDSGFRPAPAAMSRFCSTVSSSNTVEVWKVRPTPSRAIWCTFLPASWLPANSTRPVDRTRPEIASMMRGLAGAVRSDQEPQVARSTVRSTESTATNPSKDDGQPADLEVVGRHQATLPASCLTVDDRIGVSSGDPATGLSPNRSRRRATRREPRPARPPGRKAITTMNSAPWR